MNETPERTVPEQDAAAEAPLSAGAMLRQAREAAGMHIGALAVSIRVPLKKLEALEADRYEELPDAAFARALASSVCRALKIDAQPILQRLPRTEALRLPAEGARINVPFQRPGDVEGRSLRSALPKPALIAVLVLLVGALALLFLPDEQESSAVVEAAVSTAVAPAAVPADVAVTAPPAVEAPAPAGNAPTPAPEPAQAVLPAPAAAVAAVAPAPSMPAVQSAGADAASGRQLLQFKTRGPSWVEVTDAKGVVLLRRNLQPGESAAVSGALPLSVVVGRADATEVWVRGQPFPLQSVSSENVARFEVKP